MRSIQRQFGLQPGLQPGQPEVKEEKRPKHRPQQPQPFVPQNLSASELHPAQFPTEAGRIISQAYVRPQMHADMSFFSKIEPVQLARQSGQSAQAAASLKPLSMAQVSRANGVAPMDLSDLNDHKQAKMEIVIQSSPPIAVAVASDALSSEHQKPAVVDVRSRLKDWQLAIYDRSANQIRK
jgi:hypothetical protein